MQGRLPNGYLNTTKKDLPYNNLHGRPCGERLLDGNRKRQNSSRLAERDAFITLASLLIDPGIAARV